MSMRYIWEAGIPRRVMHIWEDGSFPFKAVCGIRLAFNRSINAPWGRRLCKRCLKAQEKEWRLK